MTDCILYELDEIKDTMETNFQLEDLNLKIDYNFDMRRIGTQSIYWLG
jgi:hypothetical protein